MTAEEFLVKRYQDKEKELDLLNAKIDKISMKHDRAVFALSIIAKNSRKSGKHSVFSYVSSGEGMQELLDIFAEFGLSVSDEEE